MPITLVIYVVKHVLIKSEVTVMGLQKNRGPACKIRILRYKQQNFLPVLIHNGSGYDFNLLYSEPFKQNNHKRKLDNIPLAAGKSKMFSIGCLKFLDSYNFLACL